MKLLEELIGKEADDEFVINKSQELQKLGEKNRKVEQEKMDKKKKTSKPEKQKPLERCLEDKHVLEQFEKDADKYVRERDMMSEIMKGEGDEKPKKRAKKVKEEIKEEEL